MNANLLTTIQTPLYNRRNMDELLAGDQMSAYERLANGNASDMWRKLGLAKQYHKAFATHEAFWSSDQSLLEVYRQFKDQKTRAEQQQALRGIDSLMRKAGLITN